MTRPLAGLAALRDAMKARGWVITCFPFSYKEVRYFVFVRRYVPPEPKPKYALVELTFADRSDLNRTLVAPANSAGLMIGAQDLREYFGIALVRNLGKLLAQFAVDLGRAIPGTLNANWSQEERAALLTQLSRGDQEDPNKVFCTHVRRNPMRPDGTKGQRSLFNSQKTELLRPDLYRRLSADSGVSFCYSTEPGLERTDEEIIAQFMGM